MSNFIKETWQETHPAVKTLIVVGSLAIVGYLGYKMVKGSLDFIKGLRDQNQEKQELENLADAGVSPTLSDGDINVMVNSIQTSLSGYSEDEEAVKSQLKRIQNKADWLKLNTAWNVQEITDGWGFGDKYDLVSAIYKFMPEEVSNINTDFSSRGTNVTI